MITMNGTDRVTQGAAERAGRRVAAGPPATVQNRRICTVAGLPEHDWAADH
jgi:hypothetical protein